MLVILPNIIPNTLATFAADVLSEFYRSRTMPKFSSCM